MAAAGLLKTVYLSYFSKPVADRTLYRAVRKHKPRRIVELGIGQGVRSARLLQLAQRYQSCDDIHYAGIDMFEARDPDSPRITLKQAHQQLRKLGVGVKLIPGDPYSALARAANGLTGTELLLISADQDPLSLERAWFYVPRMLSEGALVFVEEPASGAKARFHRVTNDEIASLARGHAPQRRAA